MSPIFFVSLVALTTAGQSEKAIGRQLDSFELRDFRGKVHTLGDYEKSKLLAVAFLGIECPLANQYLPKLKQMAEKYALQEVSFIAINSNLQDSLTELTGWAQRHQLAFPLLKDSDAAVADQLGASRTPEVFLLDEKRVVRYHGRIDDQFGIGYQKKEATRHDLVQAIDELLSGKEVSVAETEAPGCFIGRPRKVTPSGDITYASHIATIFNARCVSCHRSGEIAPFPMTSYDEVIGWVDTINEVISEGRMPPWFANAPVGVFKNDCRLSDEEKKLVADWVEHGAPAGDLSVAPPSPSFVDGWQIGQPDDVYYIKDEPVTIPAEGTVEYKYFVVDPGWKEDKWVQMTECRPGNRAVVHHIIAFIQEPGDRMSESRSGLGGYAPGMPPVIYEPGTANWVKAGSKIVFQMHYTPNGTEQTDRSYVGVRYADPKTIKHRASGGLAPNLLFRIPPGADNHKVSSSYRFKSDATLLTLTPHMHLRGKSFRFEAAYPDGTRELLLDIPRYDFNWQLRYELAEPKRMPKGTRLECTAHFDNSAGNLNNPDPTQWVKWGDQTWEEMMIGWFTVVRDIEPSATPAPEKDDQAAGRR